MRKTEIRYRRALTNTALPMAVTALLLLLVASSAHAQLAPFGAHNATLGPGTGVTSSVSPVGGLTNVVPLALPPARGGVPVPLSIGYSGSPRVGAAGVGWDIPLSYVRLNASATRRKPPVDSVDGQPAQSPSRIVMSVNGSSSIMVPRADGSAWVPAFADAYEELSPVPEGWELHTANGLIFTFESLVSISQGTTIDKQGTAFAPADDTKIDPKVVDPNVWLLTSVHDRAGRDRVVLHYNVHVVCGWPEIDLTRVHYGVASNGQSLYDIAIDYGATPGQWGQSVCTNSIGVTAPLLDFEVGDYNVARNVTVSAVTIRAANNLSSSTSTHSIRSYTLAYQLSPDTLLPRLTDVNVIGEQGGTGTSLPLEHYEYGAVTANATATDGAVAMGSDFSILRAYGNSLDAYKDGIAETDTWKVYPDSHASWRGALEYSATRHVIRDFTGDAVPDLVFRDSGGTWHLVPGHVRDDVELYGNDYTWTDFPEIFEQVTYQVPGDDRETRSIAMTQMTLVEFVDWDGDGRMDVLDALHGSTKDQWRVWINSGTSASHVIWRPIDVPVSNIKSEMAAHGVKSMADLEAQVAAVTIDGDRLPLSRSRSWPDSKSWECHGVVVTGFKDGGGYTYVDYPDCPGVTDGSKVGEWKTEVEWQVADANGDGAPDFETNYAPVLECEGDDTAPEVNLAGCSEPPTEVGGPIFNKFYACYQTHEEGLFVASCPKKWTPQTNDLDNFAVAFINVDGALAPASSTFVPQSTVAHYSTCSIQSWTNAVESGQTLANFETCDVADQNGDGLPDPLLPPIDRFISDRNQKCVLGAPGGTVFTSTQIAGRVDLNGDGIPDVVYRQGYTATGDWKVRFGTGAGLGPTRTIAGGFALSVTQGTCEGATQTTAGLLDVDGDGKPEVVHVTSGALLASPVMVLPRSDQSIDPLSSGRLTAIRNADGATTFVDYFNNKANALDQPLPFPEIVVSSLRTLVPAGSDPVATERFAYGNARLQYDPYFARWSFAGYERQVALTADSLGNGVATVTDLFPSVPAALVWADRARVGRPHIVSRLEGAFASDARFLLWFSSSDTRLRAQSTVEYGLVPVGTADSTGGQQECFGVTSDGSWPAGDQSLCNRGGVVYPASVVSWAGTHAPPALDNTVTSTYVTQVDSTGRPLRITEMGDTRRTDDDVCRVIDYATPPAGDRVTTVVHGVHLTDCGWSHPAIGIGGSQPGTPITIAGMRFGYDNQPEGQVTTGRLTEEIVERYDVASGAPMGQYVASTYGYDNQGNVIEIDRTRQLGGAAVQSTSITYDPWAATAVSTTVTATGAPPMISKSESSAWPSVPHKETSVNGEISTTERDAFGRPVRITKTGTDQARYVIAQASYDDTPGARGVTVTQYLGDAKDDGTPPGGVTRTTTTRFDALGRAALSWRELGASYSGILVESLTHYDPFGRVAYVADPYAAQSPPTVGTPGSVDGVSFVYDAGGRVLREIRAHQQTTTEMSTNRSLDVFVTSNVYDWRNGLAYVTTRDADANDPQSPRHDLGPKAELAATALGRIVQRAHYQGATRNDLVQLAYDHLGNQIALARYADPAGAASQVLWIDAYDSLGQRLSRSEPGQAPVTTDYDDWGEALLTKWTDGAQDRIVAQAFDGLGRLTSRVVHKIKNGVDTTESKEVLSYDQITSSSYQSPGPYLGRLSSVKSPTVATAYYGYDTFGSAATETWVHEDEQKPWTTVTTTSAGGLPLAIDYLTPFGNDRAEYKYDSAGRVHHVLFGSGSLAPVFTTATIDPLGRYRDVKLGNGVHETFSFRDQGHRELLDWKVTAANGVLERQPTGYDALARVTSLHEKLATVSMGVTNDTSYTYDTLGRLTIASGTGTNPSADSYNYDALGLTQHTDGVNAGNSRLITSDTVDPDRPCYVGAPGTSGPCNVFYDGAGDMIATGPSTDQRIFSYDSALRMIVLKRGADVQTLAYGPGGAIAREILTHSGPVVRDIRHYGSLLRFEKNPSGASYDERTIQGPLGVIATVRRTGTSRTFEYVHGDPQANRFFTDGAGGVIQFARFDPYGALRTSSGKAGTQTYTNSLWNSGPAADPFGVDLLGARAYDPTLGRFLQRDPLVNGQAANRGNPYSFAWSDPIDRADPSGLLPDGAIGFGLDPDFLFGGTGGGGGTGGWWGNLLLNVGSSLYNYATNNPTGIAPTVGTGSGVGPNGPANPFGPSPVPMPWQPGGQPVPMYIGGAVHHQIANYYAMHNKGAIIYTNDIPIMSILQDLGLPADEWVNATMRIKPDAYNATTGDVYEIKPASDIATALLKAKLYVNVLTRFNAPAQMGRIGQPGTFGMISVPGGIAEFDTPFPGVIAYRFFSASPIRRFQEVPGYEGANAPDYDPVAANRRNAESAGTLGLLAAFVFGIAGAFD